MQQRLTGDVFLASELEDYLSEAVAEPPCHAYR